MNIQSFPYDGADFLAWVEGGVRVLENHLHASAELFLVPGGHGSVPEENFAGRDAGQAHDAAGEGGFPASGFAHQAEGFALAHGKGDAVNGAHGIGLEAQQAAVHLEMLAHVQEFEKCGNGSALLFVVEPASDVAAGGGLHEGRQDE